MDVDYFYCDSCGYEDHGVYVAFSRTTASGELYLCPKCGKESAAFEAGEELDSE